MNIILFGSPGAGKGTQAVALIKRFNLFKISTGELLRKEIKKETKLGKELKLSLDKGLLVSDDIVNTLIDKIVSKKDTNILDLQSVLEEKTGLSISINNKKNNSGTISFEYKDLDQLDKLIDTIKKNY